MAISRDLIDGLFRGQLGDRLGYNDGPWPDVLTLWVHQGYPLQPVYKEVGDSRWVADGSRLVVDRAGDYMEPVPFAEHFGCDMASAGGWFAWEPLVGKSELLDETDAWEVRRNGAGAVTRQLKHRVGMVEHLSFSLTSREVWERDYRTHLLTLNPERYTTEQLVKTRTRLGEIQTSGRWSYYLHQFLWQILSQSLGEVVLFESLLLDPEWIRDFCRVYTDFFKLHYSYLFAQAGLPDGILLCDDLGYSKGLFASPKVLRDLIFPYYREMVDFFHSYGLTVVFHTCGGIAKALPDIVAAGFDALNPMERKAQGNDPFAFAEQYGDRLAFTGGMDIRVYETNDLDTVRHEITDYVQGMKSRGARLVFGSDAGISSAVHYDTYCYALGVFREQMAC